MKRQTIMISTGILFIAVSIAVIIIASVVGEEAIAMLAVASAFLFTGIMITFSGLDEKKSGKVHEIKPDVGFGKVAIAAPFGKRYALPIFLILFGTIALAISAAILSIEGFEAAGIVLLCVGAAYGIILNIYFIIKLSQKKDREEVDKKMDEMAFKVAFFFASLATGGLFAIIYLIVKRIKKGS